MSCIYLVIILFGFAINTVNESSFGVSHTDTINMHGTLSSRDTLQKNISDPAYYTPCDEDLNGSINFSPFWQLDFIGQGGSFEASKVIFQFEVFVNQYFKGHISGNIDYINAELNKYREKLGDKDVLILILINKDYLKLDIKTMNRSYTTNDQEVYFHFHPGYPSQYFVQLQKESTDFEDFYFFYIEKSNGIENLRDVRDRIEPLMKEKIPFLAYFNGPDHNAIIVSHENEPNQVDEFFNILFTSRTQPPLVPNDELLDVYDAISKLVYKDPHLINLKMYLYFNEASYSFLLEPFLTPLLETRIPKLNLLNWHASIISDFNIQSQNDQYTYINLVNQ